MKNIVFVLFAIMLVSCTKTELETIYPTEDSIDYSEIIEGKWANGEVIKDYTNGQAVYDKNLSYGFVFYSNRKCELLYKVDDMFIKDPCAPLSNYYLDGRTLIVQGARYRITDITFDYMIVDWFSMGSITPVLSIKFKRYINEVTCNGYRPLPQ